MGSSANSTRQGPGSCFCDGTDVGFLGMSEFPKTRPAYSLGPAAVPFPTGATALWRKLGWAAAAACPFQRI